MAFLLPAVLAFTLELLAAWFGAQALFFPAFRDLSRLPLIFLTMILGGGLEELGWRGVAQPLLERRFRRLASAAIVGVAWAIWHVPLFFIHGVAQYGANFPLFAADVLGNAFLLAWIYGGTGSILVCVLFHAASNTSATMGLGAWHGSPQMAWIGPAVKIALGVALILSGCRASGSRARQCPGRHCFLDGQIDQGSAECEHDVGVPHPVVGSEPRHGYAAEPRT